MHHKQTNVQNPTANHINVLQENSSILGLGPHGQQLHSSEACTDHVARITQVERQQAGAGNIC